MIEYKGYKGRLEKLDANGHVENKTQKNEPLFKNINLYAVNGAVHYANALLHFTGYTDIIAIGMTGYRDDVGRLQHEIGVYYVSKSNFGVGQKVGEYTDLSFLAHDSFDAFIEKVRSLSMTQEEIDKIKEQREREISISLTKLNNDIYQNEKGLGENDRVYLVAASIIATLGVPGKVTSLEKSDLVSSSEQGNTDGDIIFRKIKAFLNEKNLPEKKRQFIERILENTLTTDNINKAENGESQLKRVFTKIIDDLGIYYKIGLTTDFTGKLFNEMYSWLGFSQDKLNDVVLTPAYVARLLVRLARVNKDSYVWDFATGSAGLLVAAMNEMLIDAKNNIHSPAELAIKELKIKSEQMLGIEVLPSVYMLAVLNMILMGDGSSNIINEDSLKDFDGTYGGNNDSKFPADAFVLNPPYSASGNGMVFVEKALSMMERGYAAIIIQGSAGTDKATDYNKRILKRNTLLASIKMPEDLFVGKSSVQTYIYVFRVNEAHKKDDIVKFIDFSNDGYTRTNRKKASCNLRDTDHAKERYEEVANLVRFGKSKLHYLTEKEYYEGTIVPESGKDWNQTAPIDTNPTLQDFKKTVNDYLTWEVSKLRRAQKEKNTDFQLSQKLQEIEFKEFKLCKLFDIQNTNSFNTDKLTSGNEYDYVTRTSINQGVLKETGFVNKENINPAGTWSLGLLQMDFFYRKRPWYAGQFVRKIIPKIEITKNTVLFFTALLNKQKKKLLSVLVRDVDSVFLNTIVKLPVRNGEIDFAFIDDFITSIELSRLEELKTDYLEELKAYQKIIAAD